MARETLPLAAHLLKRELSMAAPKYLPAECSQGQGGQKNEEVSKAKAMCRAGDATKPEYVRFLQSDSFA